MKRADCPLIFGLASTGARHWALIVGQGDEVATNSGIKSGHTRTLATPHGRPLHVICARDVGLFSLLQQVIAQLPWARGEGRTPVVYFGPECLYFVEGGYRGADTVWEYYFEPVEPGVTAAVVGQELREWIPSFVSGAQRDNLGRQMADGTFVSYHYGDAPGLRGRALPIPFGALDPSRGLRRRARRVLDENVRLRPYLTEEIEAFQRSRMRPGAPTIGVHMRGTDAVSTGERRYFRRGSLDRDAYMKKIRQLLERWPGAQVFVATDDQASLDWLRGRFGSRVIAREGSRHESGETAGKGPLGWLMPAYLTKSLDAGAKNGEEAIIECLLLSRCDILLHNGSALARTALLFEPELQHVSLNPNNHWSRILRNFPEAADDWVKRRLLWYLPALGEFWRAMRSRLGWLR